MRTGRGALPVPWPWGSRSPEPPSKRKPTGFFAVFPPPPSPGSVGSPACLARLRPPLPCGFRQPPAPRLLRGTPKPFLPPLFSGKKRGRHLLVCVAVFWVRNLPRPPESRSRGVPGRSERGGGGPGGQGPRAERALALPPPLTQEKKDQRCLFRSRAAVGRRGDGRAVGKWRSALSVLRCCPNLSFRSVVLRYFTK